MFISVPTRRQQARTWATPLLVLGSMTGFIILTIKDPAQQAQFMARWGVLPRALLAQRPDWLDFLSDGQLPTLFSALFIHADWLHLGGNLVFLLIFGLASERAMGGWRFMTLFLLGGAIANLAAAFSLGASPDRVIVGSSGAVSAVIGAYLALFPRAKLALVLPLGLFLEFVRTPASLLIAVWAGLQLLFTFVGPAFGAVAWWAHVAGFVFGVLFALFSRAAVRQHLRHTR